MDTEPAPATLPPSLQFLKWLVIALTLTMIVGVITVVGLLVTRMPDLNNAPAQLLPEALSLPEGVTAKAVTAGQGWFGVVTEDNRILIFGTDGTLRQEIDVQID